MILANMSRNCDFIEVSRGDSRDLLLRIKIWAEQKSPSPSHFVVRSRGHSYNKEHLTVLSSVKQPGSPNYVSFPVKYGSLSASVCVWERSRNVWAHWELICSIWGLMGAGPDHTGCSWLRAGGCPDEREEPAGSTASATMWRTLAVVLSVGQVGKTGDPRWP